MKKIYVILLTLICLMGFGLSFNKVEAATVNYELVFASGTDNSDSTQAFTSSTALSNIFESGLEYVSSVSSSKAYLGKSGYGVKLGASSSSGYIQLTLNDNYSIKSITVSTIKYGSETGKLKVEYGTFSNSDKSFGGDYTYDVSAQEPGNVIKLSTTGKRGYITKVTLAVEEGVSTPIETKFQDVTVQSMLSFSYKTTSTSAQSVTTNVNDLVMHGDNDKESLYKDGSAKLNTTDMFYVDLTGFLGEITYSGSFYHNSTIGTETSTFDFVLLGADKTPIETTRKTGIVTEFVTKPTNDNGLSAQEFSYTDTLTSDVKYLGIDVTKDLGNIALDLNITGSKLTPTYDFDNVQLNFKYEYDLSSETTVTDQGFVVTSNDSFAFTQGMDVSSVNNINKTKKFSKTLAPNASAGSFTIGIGINTITDGQYDYAYCVMELRVAAYVVVGGKMYFSNVCNNGTGYSVSDILDKYADDINGSNSYDLKEYEDVINAFIAKFN